MKKRDFIKTVIGAPVSIPFFEKLSVWVDELTDRDPLEVAKDESFWRNVRSGYRLRPEYINLENGYYNFIPEDTLENYIHHIRRVNYEGSYYMRTVRRRNRKLASSAVADLIGAGHDEVIITRNATESLDMVISGYDWKPGDEAVWASHDYGAMRDQFKLMEVRHGMTNVVVDVPVHPTGDQQIVDLYKNAITDKTKLLMVCHMINVSGQILPVRKICDMAHARGVDVLVDGAHCVGHFDFNIKDLDCDYYGSSLHKWLSVPLGSGLFYIKREKIEPLWPLFSEIHRDDDDIRKLNHRGTHPCATDLAIHDAINYYKMIGPDRKEARLRYLQNRWTDQVRDYPGIQVNTPIERHRSCGIANVGIEGLKPIELSTALHKYHGIYTVAIGDKNVEGVRVSPNIYTISEEVDKLAVALKAIADKKK